jgi:hypothetical protein
MENINELAAALAKAQGEISSAEMDKTNYYGGKYATLASIQKATRPALSKNGLSIVQLTQQADNGVVIETVMLHSSGQSISSDWLMPPQQDVQKAGSYLSYIKRYQWASICGIAGDDDDDGEGAKEQPAQAKKPLPAKPKQQQKASGNGDDKSDPWPAKSGPLFEWCQAVRAVDDGYYDNQYQLVNAVGGAGAWLNNADEREAKLSKAIDRIEGRKAEKAAQEPL